MTSIIESQEFAVAFAAAKSSPRMDVLPTLDEAAKDLLFVMYVGGVSGGGNHNRNNDQSKISGAV